MIRAIVTATLVSLSSAANATDLVLKPGMKIERANALLGRPPDSTAQVGACGMMEIFNWRGNGEQRPLRLIVTDGIISSVVQPLKPDANVKSTASHR